MVLSITVRQCVFLSPDSFTESTPTVLPVSNDSERHEAYMLSHVSLLSADILPSSLIKTVTSFFFYANKCIAGYAQIYEIT